MSDRSLPPGEKPGVRLHRLLHSMRRHVDFCRTATAICRD